MSQKQEKHKKHLQKVKKSQKTRRTAKTYRKEGKKIPPAVKASGTGIFETFCSEEYLKNEWILCNPQSLRLLIYIII